MLSKKCYLKVNETGRLKFKAALLLVMKHVPYHAAASISDCLCHGADQHIPSVADARVCRM